jgi:hypothetical protein
MTCREERQSKARNIIGRVLMSTTVGAAQPQEGRVVSIIRGGTSYQHRIYFDEADTTDKSFQTSLLLYLCGGDVTDKTGNKLPLSFGEKVDAFASNAGVDPEAARIKVSAGLTKAQRERFPASFKKRKYEDEFEVTEAVAVVAKAVAKNVEEEAKDGSAADVEDDSDVRYCYACYLKDCLLALM